MKFQGITIKGAGRGKEIGFPTVNVKLSTPEYEEGVFAVRGELNEKKFEGVAHFGPRPTFEDENLSMEIHIFDFEENVIESSQVKFETIGEKIRPILKFNSSEALKIQIQRDIGSAKELLNM